MNIKTNMRTLLFLAGFCLALSTSKAADKSEKQLNVLLLCVDDLRPELASFGASYIQSPNIDKLAGAGYSFQRHFVNSPSCGPSRFTLLTGTYGSAGNNALFKRSEQLSSGEKSFPPSMPEWFRTNGYTTVSVGKVSHHPGGRGGADWNDSTQIEIPNAWDRYLMPVAEWEHPRGAMHGLAYGEIRENSKRMNVFQSAKGDDSIYPDGQITDKALQQLDQLASDPSKPFFLAVGLIKPHLPFGAPRKYLDLYKDVKMPAVAHAVKPEGKTTWHKSGEFKQYNSWGLDPNEDEAFSEEVRRHYAACVSYADAQIGKIIAKLKKTGADKNTVVVLWGDHGWHLGEHAIWGKHSLFEESLHSPLIVYYPGMKKRSNKTDKVVETLDIFPTLCQITDLPMPDFAQGESLVPIIEKSKAKNEVAIAYNGYAKTIRTATHRLTVHKDGFVELYDHQTQEGETLNIAKQHPKLVQKLKKLLQENFER